MEDLIYKLNKYKETLVELDEVIESIEDYDEASELKEIKGRLKISRKLMMFRIKNLSNELECK